MKIWSEMGKTKWGHMCLLVAVGLFSFTYNLHVSFIEGTEGLYSQVAREMLHSGDYLHLTFQGHPYINKPPLFFWMVGGVAHLFGENETTLRLTCSLFSLGTMFLTFALGRTLFSWNVGFWAGLVFATTHVFLWYGRRVLIDSTLTFFMTLALLGWVLGSRKDSSSGWYLVAFLGMALASMAKGLHGFALPMLLIIAYSILINDFHSLKQWGLWAGLILFLITLQAYASLLGASFQWHFNWQSLLYHAFTWPNLGTPDKPLKVPLYFYLIWFDFFPWSVLIPSSVMFFLSMRPLRNRPGVLFILLWFWGYFLVLLFSRYKREPFLMPLVPGFALLIGYYLVALTSSIQIPKWHRIVNGTAFAVLTVTIVLGSFFGPAILHRKWSVPSDFLPLPYIIGFVALCGFLVWTALLGQFHLMRRGVGALGVCFAFGMIQIFLPALDASSSPRMVNSKVRELAKKSLPPLYHYGITQEDLIFYLNTDPEIQKLETHDQLRAEAMKHELIVLTDKKDSQELLKLPDLVFTPLNEFPQPRGRNFVLLSIRAKPQEREVTEGFGDL